MKSILPILICSAITGALGYYFGHITVPAQDGSEATTSGPSTPVAATAEPVIEPEPIPVEPEPVDNLPETDDSPEEPDNNFAERAALSVQTLTDTQGRSIQARIIEVQDTKVKIRRNDGLETTIPLNMLSQEDVAFFNYLREQKKEEEVKKPDISEGFDWDSYFNS